MRTVMFDLSDCLEAIESIQSSGAYTTYGFEEMLTSMVCTCFLDETSTSLGRFISRTKEELNNLTDDYGRPLYIGEFILPYIYSLSSSILTSLLALKLTTSDYIPSYCQITKDYKLLIFLIRKDYHETG